MGLKLLSRLVEALMATQPSAQVVATTDKADGCTPLVGPAARFWLRK
jgi:hypothetical protein